ncbi:hypothetical protein KFU94_17845 [Chloroflexi bacterium TSY]|nr:hypothetical protein [Chloroflexi bacterium TSY]
MDEQTAPARRPGRPRKCTVTLEVADQTVLTAVDLHENWTWLLRTVRQALEPISPTGQLVNTDAAQQTILAATQLMMEMNRDEIAHFATQLQQNLPTLLAPLRQNLSPEYEAFITHLWTYRHDHQLPIEQLFPPSLIAAYGSCLLACTGSLPSGFFSS